MKNKKHRESAIPIGIKKYDFIELRFQMMREILRFNIRGIFLLVIVRCFLGTKKEYTQNSESSAKDFKQRVFFIRNRQKQIIIQ